MAEQEYHPGQWHTVHTCRPHHGSRDAYGPSTPASSHQGPYLMYQAHDNWSLRHNLYAGKSGGLVAFVLLKLLNRAGQGKHLAIGLGAESGAASEPFE